MDNVALVEILDALKQLNKHFPRLSLRQLLLHHNPIEQFALRS